MGFPVPGNLRPVGTKHKTGVIQPLSLQFRKAAAHQINLIFRSQTGKGLPNAALHRLGMGEERGIFIGADEHFRENDHICPGLLGLSHQLPGMNEIFCRFGRHIHLNHGNPHRHTLLL